MITARSLDVPQNEITEDSAPRAESGAAMMAAAAAAAPTPTAEAPAMGVTTSSTPSGSGEVTVMACGLFDGLASIKNYHPANNSPQILDRAAMAPRNRRRQARFDAYGFPTYEKRSPAKNPVSAVVELKLLSGVISQEEAEAILKIVHPATDTALANGSGVSAATLEVERHSEAWDTLINAVLSSPVSPPPPTTAVVLRPRSSVKSPAGSEADTSGLRPPLSNGRRSSPAQERRLFLSPSPMVSRIGGAPSPEDGVSPLASRLPLQRGARPAGLQPRPASADPSPGRPRRRFYASPADRHTSPMHDPQIPEVASADVFPVHASITDEAMQLLPIEWSEDDGMRERSLSDPCLLRESKSPSAAAAADHVDGEPRIVIHRNHRSTKGQEALTPVVGKGHRRTRSLPAGTLQFRLLALNLTPLRAPQAADFSSQRPSTSTSGLSSDDGKTTPPLIGTALPAVSAQTPPPLAEQSPWDMIIQYELPVGQTLTALVERGIPPRYRSFMWHALINGYIGRERVARGPGYYRALSNVHAEINRKAQKQIEMDLPRTFPENRFFRKGKSLAITRLRRVLFAYTRRNETIGYCQGFNFIAGFALLVLPEESAFWCLVTFIEHIMPSNYFLGDLSSARDDQLIFRRIVEQQHPEIHAQLQKYDFDISIVTFSWFMTLFVDDIPPDVTLQIWDNLLLRGSIVLFQNASAFLSIGKEQILAANSRLELFSYMLSLSSQVDDIALLAKAASHTSTITWVFLNSERAKLRDAAQELRRAADGGARPKSPARKRLNFSQAVEWWEPLCSSAEVRALFAATTGLCRRMAGSRGITYMRLKRELREVFSAEVIERNQHVLQKILQVHESRMEAIAAREQGSADFKFDDVVLYPALSSINKLESVPHQFQILEKQAALCLKAVDELAEDGAYAQTPPSPLLLPASLKIRQDSDGTESSVVSSGPASEQVLRNRTAEICTQHRDSKLHYMTVKRRLISEFGVDAYEKYKRAVQSVFRMHESRSEGLQVKGARSRTGEVRRRLQYPTESSELGSTATCLLYVPTIGPPDGVVWSGLSDGGFVVFTPAKESAGRMSCVLAPESKSGSVSGAVAPDVNASCCTTTMLDSAANHDAKRIAEGLAGATVNGQDDSNAPKLIGITCMVLGDNSELWAGRTNGTIVVFSAQDPTKDYLVGCDEDRTGQVLSTTISKYSIMTCCDSAKAGAVAQICLRQTKDDDVWCAVSTGELVEIDRQAHHRLRSIKLQIPLGSFYAPKDVWGTNVTGVHELDEEPEISDLLSGSTTMPKRRFSPAAMILVGDTVWIGTGRHLIVHSIMDDIARSKSKESDTDVLSPQRYGVNKGKLSLNGKRRFVMECNSTLCLVTARGGEIWSCAYHDPYMVVWDATREGQPLKKAEFAVPWGERGIVQLLSQSGFVWAACRDGSIIVWNPITKNPIMSVRDSAIPITQLCAKSGRSGTEVFGLAKGAAYTIVVWNA